MSSILRIPNRGFEDHPEGIKQTLHIDDEDYDGNDYLKRMYKTQWDLYVAAWRRALGQAGAPGRPPQGSA